MRKLLFTLLLTTCACGFTMAQSLQFGIKTGLSIASESLVDPDVLSTNSITTYYLGVYAQKPLKNSWFIETDLSLGGKGVTAFYNSETRTYSLTYLSVPINLLYKFNIHNLGKIYVGGGPYISGALSGNIQTQDTNNSTGMNIEFGNTKDYKRVDFGADLAAGFELNNHLTFNTSYSLGLNNIAPDDPENTTTVTSIKNRLFSIGLGFIF